MFSFSYQQAIDLQTEYHQLEESKNTDELIRFYETHHQQWREMIDASTEKYTLNVHGAEQ